MRILVTGAAGAIGSHVAEAFARRGNYVRGSDSLTPYYSRAIKEINVAEIKNSGVEFVRANLCTDDLTRLLDGIDVVYHFAAQPGISAATPFAEYLNNNIVATFRLLEAVRKSSNLRLFVHASTSSIYGRRAAGDETVAPAPTSYYGVTKLAAEQLALSYYREQGLPVVVLRLFSVYGERERPDKLFHKLISSILNDKVFPLHEGSEHHTRSYTAVQDIVDGCFRVIEYPDKCVGQIFNLGTDQVITTGEAIRLLETIMGKRAVIKAVPRRPGDQVEMAANIAKARAILGYEPVVKLADGLARELRWYKEKICGKL
jgi:nucleoside-diphosphate-sugar epimerase